MAVGGNHYRHRNSCCQRLGLHETCRQNFQDWHPDVWQERYAGRNLEMDSGVKR